MATPADQRLLELLDKWLKSLELHLNYSTLDDDSYLKIQAWPEHQRPSRWIVDLARQKALALQVQIQDRIKMGDSKFADSLELMIFLANLLGAEHIERFIPMANGDTERSIQLASAGDPTSMQQALAVTATREMPKFIVGKERTAEAPGTGAVARVERKAAIKPTGKKLDSVPAAAAAQAPEPKHRAPDAKAKAVKTPPGDPRAEAVHEQVIADAARLVQWGRKWYELAELISSMADRPSLIEVRRILKDNKAVIEKKAGRN